MMARILLFLLFTVLCQAAIASNALVDSLWLKQNFNKPGIVVMDIQERSAYLRYHVPGAVNAPYSFWRTGERSKQPGMLPNTEAMQLLLSQLGIRNSDHLVITSIGVSANDMAAAARVFWTLKTLGHKKLSILDGGLVAYANRFGGKLDNKPVQKPDSKYTVSMDASIIADQDKVKDAIKNNRQLSDSRTLAEYTGVIDGNDKQRGGTLPQAKHLPFDWLVNEQGFLRNKEQIKKLYQAQGLSADQDGTIHFCQSGNRASLNWFVDYALLGHKNAKLYDGSMAEWARKADKPESRPMVRQIDL